MLEDDYIRELVIDGLLRDKLSVTEFISKLRYYMKEDVNKAYISGYSEGYSFASSKFGVPPNYNPNL